MKKLFISFLLCVATTLDLFAQTTVPVKSTLRINMTHSLEKRPKNVGKKCHGTHTNSLLDPEFIKGKDLTASDAVLSLYILSGRKNEKRKMEYKIFNPISQLVPETPDIPLVKHKIQELRWQCSCCRDSEKVPVPIWYAEVRQDGKILCSTQSDTNPDFQAAVETRTVISESEISSLPTPAKSTRTPIKLSEPPINITRGEREEKRSTLGVKTNDVVLITTASDSKAVVQFTKFEGAEDTTNGGSTMAKQERFKVALVTSAKHKTREKSELLATRRKSSAWAAL